ncbi:MAG: tetratricopeptide repeat protein [Methanocorpusculum sp.]|uniref:tetratricopeptide repeat protein n=1 Tax=Methanocorpusculum sp. TaxID=2058474 RepID=UPI002725FFA2|nr:tetratricopeptide repeat protein [Methanocorpusculum sp.]MDO9522443.1 tetratricopeptide repeat protein [Methanocorpusculum sp.]
MFQKIRRLFADPPQPAEICQPQNTTPEQIIERLEREAAEGKVDAIYLLGMAYYSVDGAAKDPGQAKAWFEKAAAEGNTAAMRNLAEMYTAGNGVEKDPVKAKEWVRKAEEIEIMLKALGLVWGVAE